MYSANKGLDLVLDLHNLNKYYLGLINMNKHLVKYI